MKNLLSSCALLALIGCGGEGEKTAALQAPLLPMEGNDLGKSVWTERHPGGAGAPDAVEGAAMAYDTARSRVVLAGGKKGDNSIGDTWEWNGATGTWTKMTIIPTIDAGVAEVPSVYDHTIRCCCRPSCRRHGHG
jgi:hypothetical protein